jgi:hypothetical protein
VRAQAKIPAPEDRKHFRPAGRAETLLQFQFDAPVFCLAIRRPVAGNGCIHAPAGRGEAAGFDVEAIGE